MDKKYTLLGTVAGGLAGVMLTVGFFPALAGLSEASSSPAPVSVTITGDNNVVVIGGLLGEKAPLKLFSDDVQFGATSGTQYSLIPSQTTVSTTGSFLSNTTLTFDVVAGTMATGTNTGTTSTVSIPGRTCFFVTTPTGTRFAVTFPGGDWTPALGDCD